MLRHLVIALLAPSALVQPILAQTAMDASEFAAHVTGRTLTFSANGTEYGAEEYGPDRRVRWSFLDGQCRTGEWYPAGDQICFVYEGDLGPQCWRFFNEGGGLRAEFMGEGGSTVLYETEASDEPLLCYGPDVGV